MLETFHSDNPYTEAEEVCENENFFILTVMISFDSNLEIPCLYYLGTDAFQLYWFHLRI